MAGLRAKQAARARAWPLGVSVMIQTLYRDRKKVWLLAVSRYSTTRVAIRLLATRHKNAATRLGRWGLCCDTNLVS